MLALTELQHLLKDLESDRVERTESITNTDKFCEAVCAFANDLPNSRKPGYLLIGVRNDGGLSGLKVSDQLLTNLGGIRSDGNVLPQPRMDIAKFSLESGDIVVVEVYPSDLPPVRYKGRVHIRVGPRKAVANEQEERVLSEKRVASARSFDVRPCPEATLEDIALGQFATYRREAIDADTVTNNHRPIEQQLASLRLFDPQQACPTNAGILLFGKNPRYFLPGAYIQYLRFSGADLTTIPDDQAEVSGDFYATLRELEARIKLLIQTHLVPISALEEKMRADYPEWALRELLMNAVMHRNYNSNTPIRLYSFSTHIEIHSPGGLYGESTPENFPTRSSYRNPVIAEAMKTFGFVNRFGYGVQRAQSLLAENGNPPAEFSFDAHSVLVTIRKRTP